MKIKVLKKNKSGGFDFIKVYHSPKEVVIHPKAEIVDILNTDGILLRTYDLVEVNTDWLDDLDLDTREQVMTIWVKGDKKKGVKT